MKNNKNKEKKNVLSKLLKEFKNKTPSIKSNKHIYENIEPKEKNLKSNLEAKNLDEFLEIAQLSNKKYEVLNEQIVLQNLNTNNKEIGQNQFSKIFLSNVLKNSEVNFNQVKPLAIPKKPKWKEGISKVEYEKMEVESFLNWRKALAEEEEKNINYAITPFEKNIEVWRQLWLVVDKCEILIIIVDGRNPLYFRCPDLENYIKEVREDKEFLIIINKADLMSDEVRAHWAEYFNENNIKFIYFSALDEIIKIENEEINKDIEDDDKSKYLEKKSNIINDIKIKNRDELIQHIKHLCKNKIKNNNHNCYFIGFIGYPNVGKSSVINVIMKKKRVGVALMPGKTKHYQTLYLPDDKEYCLMDCPGLVFPSFTNSKSDMLVNGILPIDTLREYHEAISIIIKRIPRKILSKYYKINLPDIYSATQFLQVLAQKRGYFSGRALPDEAKTAKIVLKDYVSGKLLYCNLRPDYDEKKHGVIINYLDLHEVVIDEVEKEKQNLIKEIPADYDENFEKINIQFENMKVKENDDDIDRFFFEISNDNKDDKITKDMKRAIKFAMKRGEITEEEYENINTIQQFQELMEKLKKIHQMSKKDLVGSKKISF